MKSSKQQSRGISPDMRPEEIKRRLKLVAELNELCAALVKAKIGAGK